MKLLFRFLLGCAALALHAAPAPHATRAGRLVETRGEFSVEYSPGQEAWMEMAFTRMQAETAHPAPSPEEPATPPPGSSRDLHARRETILAAVAREIGLPAATPLQIKTFDTFLGHYDRFSELYRFAASSLHARLEIRHVAIWQRDQLIERLRAGEKITGVTYDPATDSGQFGFNLEMEPDAPAAARVREIDNAIKAQQLNHTFVYDQSGFSASVTPYAPPAPVLDKPAATSVPPPNPFPEIVVPVTYRDPFDTAPTSEFFDATWSYLREAGDGMELGFRNYTDPTVVGIILHETIEIGLVDRIIASKDRRWLCDGTANYAAWKISRDFFGADFAQRVYDLDAKLREYAALQPKINLARWSAAEKQGEAQKEAGLNRAHYVFATRAMFLLTGQHGDDALAQLWHDVAQTDRKKVTAATFAKAYRKRYRGDLAALVKAAERNPIPAPPPPPAVAP